jgi:hypothetical protein
MTNLHTQPQPQPHYTMKKGIVEKMNLNIREAQKKAAQLDAALSRSEQQKSNEALAARTKQRKAIPQNFYNDKELIADALITENPEVLAACAVYDFNHLGQKGYSPLIRTEVRAKLAQSFTDKDKWETFMGYMKFAEDLRVFAKDLASPIKTYTTCVTTMALFLEKYESIERDKIIFDILFQCVTMGSGHTGIKYALHSDATEPKKSLDETTPEELLAEMNEVHKGNGVIFKDGGQGELVADIEEGGLYEKIMGIKSLAEVYMTYCKSHIEAAEEYIAKHDYSLFVPRIFTETIADIKEEKITRPIIAPDYHRSEINRKKREGLPITPEEERMAVVPDYNAMEPTKEQKQQAINDFTTYRNATRY